jgi:hypothetical protein
VIGRAELLPESLDKYGISAKLETLHDVLHLVIVAEQGRILTERPAFFTGLPEQTVGADLIL